MSIAGSVAACLLALLRNVRLGGRCDGGIDALGGEFVENGEWRGTRGGTKGGTRGGTRGGNGVENLVSHCQVNDVSPKEGTWPVETDFVLEVQTVNADAGATTKLSVGEMDLA